MEFAQNLEWLVAFLTLFLLELVLGIDNVIFISILSSRLPKNQQQKARSVGLFLAMGTRILLLLALSWVIGLVEPLITIFGVSLSGRDLILVFGGLFLIAKSTHEIHQKLEAVEEGAKKTSTASFQSVIIQILLLDIVFSLDSVITAVGMVKEKSIMISAVIASALITIFMAKSVSDFVEKHPTIKMLALSFLLLIGVTLLVEGFGQHVGKGYIYFSMGFSLFVEFLNLRLRKKNDPIHLRKAL